MNIARLKLSNRYLKTALVSRAGVKLEIPVRELTIGDIVYLSQGSIIPADLRLIETKNLELNQSTLTGEAKTAFKTGEAVAVPKNESSVDNFAYMGTRVENGTGVGVVCRIGKNTSFGKIAEVSSFIRPVTDFQKGLTQFGNLIIKVIVIMTIMIFGVNLALGHPMIDSLLFSLAIAVGLTPELLPVIVTVSLAHGAWLMAPGSWPKKTHYYQTAYLHRKPRQHGCSLYRQNGDPNRGAGQCDGLF